MSQSSDIKDLASALAKAQSQLTAAKKDATNPHFKSLYATLQSVWEAARAPLYNNGLSIAQTFEATDGTRMEITTTLIHVSGQWIAGTLSMIPQRQDPQGIGSAITYGRRYALASILGIVAEEDDDGNAASQQPMQGAARPSSPTAQPVQRTAQEFGNPKGDAHWKEFIVPPFITKYKGRRMGEMDDKDILWWVANYKPKPYNGAIQEKDIAFRFALDQAKIELDSKDIKKLPPRTEPSEAEMANVSKAKPGDEDSIPF